MPINKFNGYYYGVGLKLDEKSVNDLSKQIENKLNKTVANVREEIASLQEALKFGKNADLTPLIASLNAAATGVRGVNDADFNILKAQVDLMKKEFDGLSESVTKLGVNLDDTAVKFASLVENLSTKIDRFMSQPSTMRDNLKRDLRTMQDMTRYYSEALKVDPNASTTGLEAYFAEFKKQFGNIGDLSDIATQEIAQDFLRLGDLLRKSGLPIDGIRSELLQMTTQLEAAFKLKNPAGVGKAFDSIGYKVDAAESKLASIQKKMQDLEKESERLSSMLDKSGKVKFNGGTLAKEDKILNLEEQIAKIKEYEEAIYNLDDTDALIETYKKQISLIRSVEKEISKLDANDDLAIKWSEYFSSFNLPENEDSLVSHFIRQFSDDLKVTIDDISQERINLDTEAKKLTQSIAELAGTQKKLNDVKTKKPGAHQVKGKLQEQYELNLSEEVNLKAKIDNEAWRKAINASIAKIEQKIVPIKIKAELKDAEKVKGEITKLKNAQLMTDGTKKKGKDAGADKDAETFNKRFERLLKTINDKKSELKDALDAWHKEFDKMFEFQFKVHGLKKDEYGNLSTVIAELVDNINTTLEDKPLKFTSNIEELVQSINEQLKNIKIDNLQIGGLSADSLKTGGFIPSGGFYIPVNPNNNGGEGTKNNEKKPDKENKAPENKNQSGTDKAVKNAEEQVKAILEAYKKLTDTQRNRIAKKSPDFANAMADLEKNPTWDNYQKNILRFADLTKIINDVRPNNGIQQFIDKIQEDILAYDQLDDAGKKSASRADSYVANIVKEYFNQISKTSKPNKALASNKDLFGIFEQLKKAPTYENYKKLVLNNAELGANKESIFSALEGVRPTSKVQDFINLLVSDQKAYIAAFGKPVVESAAAKQNRQWFENGKQIVEYVIQLAQMAAKIQPLRTKPGVKITEDLFKDGEFSRWISGIQITRDNLKEILGNKSSAVVGKKDVSDSDIDSFLSRMGMTRGNLVAQTDENTSKYVIPLLSAIDNLTEKQEMLDKALEQLQSSKPTKNMQNFIEGFKTSENKEIYLANSLKGLQSLAKKGATTDAQKYMANVFKDHNIDISKLKTSKTLEEQWGVIQEKILANPQVDFNKLMDDLRAGKDKFSSSYKDFVEIIGIAKRFVTTSEALSDIGKTANTIIEGTEETITKRNEKGEVVEKKIKVNGLRSELNKYGIVITGEDGRSFGYRAGQETVENGVFGDKNAFTQIANQLTAALKNAVDIAFSKNKVDGLDVKQYKPTASEPKATYTQDIYFNRDLALQRRDWYQSEINKLNTRLQRQENNLKTLQTQEGFDKQLNTNLNKNKRYVELNNKRKSGTATLEEKAELIAIIDEAEKSLRDQTKRLAESIQNTKNDLEALDKKLKQSKKDYNGFNSQIKQQEKAFKNGTYQPPRTPSGTPSGSSGGSEPSGGAGFYLPSGAGGGFAVLGGSTDIATESTVRAIYNALVGNNGKDNPQLNARIEALEKAIAEKEAAIRKEKENPKTGQDKKPPKKDEKPEKKGSDKGQSKAEDDKKKAEEERQRAEAERRRVEEEARKKEEERKKAEEQKRQAEEEARKKAEEAARAKAEAEKKKAEEERKRAEAEKQKAEAERKKAEEAARKKVEEESKKDTIQKTVGKSEKDLFAASNKYMEETNSFMKIFREHSFIAKKGIVTDVNVGTHSKAPGFTYGNYDMFGHLHPANSAYSAQDINTIINRKSYSKEYDRDILVTPNQITELKNLRNTSVSTLKMMYDMFDSLEDSYDVHGNYDLLNIAKTSVLKSLSDDGKISFSAYNKNDDGSLTDITSTIPKISQELLTKLLILGTNEKAIQSLTKDKKKEDYENTLAYKNAIKNRQDILSGLYSSDEFKQVTSHKINYGNNEPAGLWRSATAFQDALNNGWDLSPLTDAFKGFMTRMEGVENLISKDSPYFKIKDKYNEAISQGTFNKDFLPSIKPLLQELFGAGQEQSPDKRLSNQYSKLYPWFDKKYPGWKDNPNYSYEDDVNLSSESSLVDMKAELAFLKSMQSGTGVNFATKDKQDQIISILQGGIKVKGIEDKDKKKTDDGKDKKQEKNLQPSEQAKQAQKALGSMSEEASVKIDSTGKQTIHTIQKIGAETAKVTQVTEDGVTKSTLELSNKYETAMKSLFQKIRGDSGKYLFGAETVRFGVDATEAQDTLLNYVDTYRQLEEAMEQYKKSGDILLTEGPNQGKQLQTVINELQTQLGQYEQRLISISNASQSFLGGKAPFAMLDGNQVKDSANSLKLLAASTEPLGVAFNGVYNNGKKLMYDVLDNGIIKSYALEVDEATGNVRKMEVSQTALVNALQNVNKAAKQSEELKNIFTNDDVNQDSTVIQNYKNAYKEMNDYVRQSWDAARQNGGLIPMDEQDKIYALSQEVLRLGATIQKEYKRIATIRDSGTPFESLGKISNTEEVETKMRQYLNRFAEGQTLQVSNLQYDSVTQSMTADLVDLYGIITKVKLEYNELLNSVNVSSAKGTNSIDDMSTKMINIGDNINQALGAGVINENLEEYKAYAAEVAKLDELIANIENGTIAYNVDAIQQWNAQRQAVIDTGKALSEVAQINAKKSLPGVRAVEAQSNKRIKIDNMVETIPGAQDSSQYQSYITAYEKLLTLRERFRTEGTLGLESNQKQLQVEADKVNQLANSLSKLLQESVKIRSSASDEDILKLPNSFDVQNLEAEMKKFAGISSNATKEQWKFNNATNSANYVIKGADNVVSEMTVTYDALTNTLVRTTNQQYKVKTALQEFVDSVGNKFKELGRYLLSFGSFYQIWGVVRQGVTYVRDIDSALTELKKVTDETDASYARFLQNMSKTGSVVGATVADLTTSAADWARLGSIVKSAPLYSNI